MPALPRADAEHCDSGTLSAAAAPVAAAAIAIAVSAACYDSSTRYDSSRLETSRQDANGARNVSYYTSSAHSTPQSTPGNTLGKKTSYSVTREFAVNQDSPAAAAGLAGGLAKLTIERASPAADRTANLDSSITEGPSFSDSLKHFKSFAGGSSSANSSFNKSSSQYAAHRSPGGDPMGSLTSAEQMLSQTSQRMEKTITMSNTSRSYRSGSSGNT